MHLYNLYLRAAPVLASLTLVGALGGCSSSDSNTSSNSNNSTNNSTNGSTNNSTNNSTSSTGLNVDYFEAAGLATAITQVDCTLSNGEATTCYRVVISGVPSDHEIGPFCPRTIDDGPEDVGIWLDDGNVYDVDGAFITGLAEFYNDPTWQLYDEETGVVRVTLTQEACEAAARPDVDPAYQNYCVECSLEDVGGGVETEFLIPLTPVPRTTASELGMSSVGVSLSGGHYDPPAPVDAILGAHTIAAFDDCGGHVNPAAGYHYHAATGCPKEVAQDDGHAPLIGYALDGYALYAMVGDDDVEPSDLDSCRGHSDDQRGYHYHVASAGENMFIGCFHGETVGTTAELPGGGPPNNGGGAAAPCAEGQTSQCCGDGTCEGPETAANCSEDC